MCKYHSVFVSTAGQVYTCGHGRGGRLGHGHELTVLVRVQLLINAKMIHSYWSLVPTELMDKNWSND